MATSTKQLMKELRKKFNEVCLQRDGNSCVCCKAYGAEKNVVDSLDVHHICDRHEMPNNGYAKENGITLCSIHHFKAELFHMTGGKKYEKGFHPDDLYKLIGSSKEKAIIASERLVK
jgi:hypothetical protein